MAGKPIGGWKLPRDERARLLERFPPRYATPVADHVTFKPGPGNASPPKTDHCVLVGRADDGEGVEAMVVAIHGSTDRPDGSTWHITWSLDPGRKAKESNDVIAASGWKPVEGEIRIPLEWSVWHPG
ncbi:hypothetical protein [Altericroceibacterium xinjiangense]|uniref:hypothetical protein n=1 Tax=Altericroceibacterium xinjiangense TaxID=762261 RepID=UPI000F7F77F0|nr:hypothetical protein [Altericroceibacterium xinjiangense]